MKDKDYITWLEIARLAMSTIPEDITSELDMSDDEFIRLRDKLDDLTDYTDEEFQEETTKPKKKD